MTGLLNSEAGEGVRKELTDEQLLRYSRQIMLPNIDISGQELFQKI